VFTIRVAAFIISLLLVTGAVEASQGWFASLAVLTGLSIFGWSGRAPRIYAGPRTGLRWRHEDAW
jgi:hypothetical protein